MKRIVFLIIVLSGWLVPEPLPCGVCFQPPRPISRFFKAAHAATLAPRLLLGGQSVAQALLSSRQAGTDHPRRLHDFLLSEQEIDLPRKRALLKTFLARIASYLERGYLSPEMAEFSQWIVGEQEIRFAGALRRPELTIEMVDAIVARLQEQLQTTATMDRELAAIIQNMFYGFIREPLWYLEDEITYANFYPGYRQVIRERLRDRRRILVIGCGMHGKLEALLQQDHKEVVGIDLRPAAVKNPGLRKFILGDAHKLDRLLPVREESRFDAVIFPESIGYFDVPTVLAQVKKFLAPGGKILITTYPPYYSRADEPAYARYTPEEWKKIVTENGFSHSPIKSLFFLSYGHVTLPGHVIIIELGIASAPVIDSRPHHSSFAPQRQIAQSL